MWYIFLMLLFLPLPFGSARPVWHYFWAIYVAFACFYWIFSRKRLSGLRLPKEFYAPVGATVLLISWGLIQTLAGWSVSPRVTVSTSLVFFTHLAWFFLVFSSLRDGRDVSRLIVAGAVIVTVYCIYGLCIYFAGNNTILWYEKWASVKSLTATFVNRNSFAAFVGLGLQCLVAYILRKSSSEASEDLPLKRTLVYFFNENFSKSILVASSLILIFTCLLLTGSRAGILATFAGLACLIVGHLIAQKPAAEASSGRSTRVSLLSILFVSIVILVISGGPFQERMLALNDNDLRFAIYPTVLGLIKHLPPEGTGLGTFAEVFAQYRGSDIIRPILRAHNDVLEIIITAGIFVGTIFVISMVSVAVSTFRMALKGREYHIYLLLSSSCGLQLGLHSLVDFPLQIPAVSYFFTALLAASAFISLGDQYQPKSNST